MQLHINQKMLPKIKKNEFISLKNEMASWSPGIKKCK
jgi:hypothetical protein